MTAAGIAIDAELHARIDAVRADVANLHGELVRYGLVVWTGGNVSGRVPGADLFVIKPSGVSYGDLAPENMILCDLDGNVVPGTAGSDRSPSSDTAAHAYVYRNMPEVGGVVHTHSDYAVAWAARGGDPVRHHGDGRRVRRPDPGRPVRDHRRRLDRPRHRRDAPRAPVARC
jgi:L-ribulose-5-phosphate 4-epimerase